ncbi:Malonyl CoA-acyl carrier protein transacylase [Rhizobiaceae bacterium]|nr:Malonyl CoA-acyl carrier protein transacylase [Rhizobiaceae bacterium]
MKTYAVYSGLEALQQASRTRRWLDLPEVAATLDEVSGYLSEATGRQEDIATFLRENARPHRADMDRLFIAHTAMQVGISRAVMRRTRVDGLAGCSMGDLARAAVSGATTLRQMIGIVWHLAQYRHLSPPGELATVRPVEGLFDDRQMEWLRGTGVSLSLWSERYGALAGSSEVIDALKPRGREFGLKISQLYPYPFHSELMRPVAESIRGLISGWDVRPPAIPVYSSVFLRPIVTADDVREEALAGASNPVQWFETIRNLRNEYGVTRIINIGPTDTITAWIPQSAEFSDVEVVEAWDLCGADVAEGCAA